MLRSLGDSIDSLETLVARTESHPLIADEVAAVVAEFDQELRSLADQVGRLF